MQIITTLFSLRFCLGQNNNIFFNAWISTGSYFLKIMPRDDLEEKQGNLEIENEKISDVK